LRRSRRAVHFSYELFPVSPVFSLCQSTKETT
jgi:hypothetical protein